MTHLQKKRKVLSISYYPSMWLKNLYREALLRSLFLNIKDQNHILGRGLILTY